MTKDLSAWCTDPGALNKTMGKISLPVEVGSQGPLGMTRLFAYGTLKPGESRYPVIERYVRSCQPAHVIAKLADMGAYPALVFGFGYVKGFLLELYDEAAFEITDRIEAVDAGLFRRKRTLSATKESVFWCVTYEYAREKIEASESLVTAEVDGIPVFEWHGSK